MLSHSTNLCETLTLLLWAWGNLWKAFSCLPSYWFCWHDQDYTTVSLSGTSYLYWGVSCSHAPLAWLGTDLCKVLFRTLTCWVLSLNGCISWSNYAPSRVFPVTELFTASPTRSHLTCLSTDPGFRYSPVHIHLFVVDTTLAGGSSILCKGSLPMLVCQGWRKKKYHRQRGLHNRN